MATTATARALDSGHSCVLGEKLGVPGKCVGSEVGWG